MDRPEQEKRSKGLTSAGLGEKLDESCWVPSSSQTLKTRRLAPAGFCFSMPGFICLVQISLVS